MKAISLSGASPAASSIARTRRLGGRHDGQAVRPALLEAELDRLGEVVDGEALGGEFGGHGRDYTPSPRVPGSRRRRSLPYPPPVCHDETGTETMTSSAAPGRLLLDGVRPARGVPLLRGRPRHPRRRLHEVGGRPRPARRRHRPALGAGLHRAAHRPRRLPDRRVARPPARPSSTDTGVRVRVRIGSARGRRAASGASGRYAHRAALPARARGRAGPLDHPPPLRHAPGLPRRPGDAARHRRRARAAGAAPARRASTTSTRATPSSRASS